MNNLKDRMYDHEEMPPTGTWERIAVELEKPENVIFYPAEPRVKPIFNRLAIAASFLAVVLTGVFYLTNYKKSDVPEKEKKSLSTSKMPPKDERYIIVTNPNGQKTRISSKFTDYVGSIYQNTEQNPDWSRKFSEWREIMQNKALTPATPNFLDVIEMSDFLEQAN